MHCTDPSSRLVRTKLVMMNPFEGFQKFHQQNLGIKEPVIETK